MSKNLDQYSDREAARRRNEALRRAQHAALTGERA